jgi:hypothetical protein
MGMTCHKPTFGYLSDLDECPGDHVLTEIRRFQMAEKPPSTDNSTGVGDENDVTDDLLPGVL